MRYISEKIISFSIEVKGADKRVRFSPCMSGGSIYLTNSAEEIKVLENSGMFKRGLFKRAPGCENEEIPGETDETETANPTKEKAGAKKTGAAKGKEAGEKVLAEVADVESWQDAVDYLVNKCGSDASALATPDAIVKEATDKGIRFPNVK